MNLHALKRSPHTSASGTERKKVERKESLFFSNFIKHSLSWVRKALIVQRTKPEPKNNCKIYWRYPEKKSGVTENSFIGNFRFPHPGSLLISIKKKTRVGCLKSKVCIPIYKICISINSTKSKLLKTPNKINITQTAASTFFNQVYLLFFTVIPSVFFISVSCITVWMADQGRHLCLFDYCFSSFRLL